MQPVVCSTRRQNQRKGVSPKCNGCPRQIVCYQLSVERFKRKVFKFFGVFAMAVLIVGFVLNNFDVINILILYQLQVEENYFQRKPC